MLMPQYFDGCVAEKDGCVILPISAAPLTDTTAKYVTLVPDYDLPQETEDDKYNGYINCTGSSTESQ